MWRDYGKTAKRANCCILENGTGYNGRLNMDFPSIAFLVATVCVFVAIRVKEIRVMMLLLAGVCVFLFFVASGADTEKRASSPERLSPPAQERPVKPPTPSRLAAPAQPERKYLKVTSATMEGGYAIAVVQGTKQGVPIQCVVQHKISKDYIATQTWYATDDLATEVVIRMPDVFSTASLVVICFEID